MLKTVLLCLVVAFSCVGHVNGDEREHVTGTVASEDGTPVSGVQIFAWHDAITDREGRFDLPNRPAQDEVIFFSVEGYLPTFAIIGARQTALKVVLRSDKKTAWVIPNCPPNDKHSSPDPAGIRFLLPNRARVKKVRDIDYEEFFLAFRRKDPQLELWWGTLVSAGEILGKLILASTAPDERSILNRVGRRVGSDFRGKTSDGKFWRSADFPGLEASAIYIGVSHELVSEYDRVIDSACDLEPAAPK